MDDYISIKDFASRAGVSQQAVYQRLVKDLTSYVKVVDGKKRISIQALDFFTVKNIEQESLKSLQDTIRLLSIQLEVKDKQIDFLQEQLQAAQVLHAATMQTKILVDKEVEEKKPRFWLARLFNKESKE